MTESKNKILFFLISLFCVLGVNLEVQSQHIVGVKASGGYGRLGEDPFEQSLSYGSTVKWLSYAGTKEIAIFYEYQLVNFLGLRTEINFSKYKGAIRYYYDDHDPHEPGYNNEYNCYTSFYAVGIPIYLDLKLKNTHFYGGLSYKTSLAGKYQVDGSKTSYDYYFGMVTTTWNHNLKISPFTIKMTGFTAGVNHDFSDKISLGMSFSKYKFKSTLPVTFLFQGSFEVNFSFYYKIDFVKFLSNCKS